MMIKEHFEEIDLIKGYCMLLVFFQHSILYFPINFNEIYPWCKFLTDAIDSFFMPCFFLVSGFLFSRSKKKWNVVIYDKVRRILIPYLFICILSFAVKLCVPNLAFSAFPAVSDYINYYFLYGGDRWFLYVLFVIFLFISPIKTVLQKSVIYVLLLLCLLLGIMKVGTVPYEFLLSKSCYMCIFFISGFIVQVYYIGLKDFIKRYKWYILAMSIVINCLTINLPKSFITTYIIPFIGIFGTFALAYIIINNIKYRGYIQIFKIFSFVGKYSLQYYLFTGYVLVIARTLIVNIFRIENPFMVIPSVFIIQIIIATFGVIVCKRIPVVRTLLGY